MINTGINRPLDSLGRVVIPKALRETLNIETGSPVAFFVEGETIIIKRYTAGCFLCGDIPDDAVHFKGKLICGKCKSDLAGGVS